MGLPVLGVVAYAGSFADGVHTSIPAPGIGALAAGLGGERDDFLGVLVGAGQHADAAADHADDGRTGRRKTAGRDHDHEVREDRGRGLGAWRKRSA